MNFSPSSDFARQAKAEMAAMVGLRRQVHANPELGFAEYATACLVATHLAELGCEVTEKVAGTGVVGLIRGAASGPTVALRADMDALPIEEQTGLEYASRCPGVMHACGHDAHIAMALGAASLLAACRERWRGNVKLIFQPCEETAPGGAASMITAGVLDNPPVDAVIGLHVIPDCQVGCIGVKDGVAMAAADPFRIEVVGRSGHGAAPHQAVDAVVAAAAVVMGLQTIASRLVDPVVPVVVTVGTVQGGCKSNVIADRVEMTGTVRTILPELRREIPEMMRRILDGVAAAYGCRITLDFQWGYPPLVNDPAMVALIEKAAAAVIGTGDVRRLPHPLMVSEDFAYYLQKVPGAMFLLGAGKREGPVHPWHHPGFDIDEEALPIGAAVLAQAAWDFLGRSGEVS